MKNLVAISLAASLAALPAVAAAERTTFSATNCHFRAYDEAYGLHNEGGSYAIAGMMTITNSSTVVRAHALCPVPLQNATGNTIIGGTVYVNNYSSSDPVSCTMWIASPYGYFYNAQTSSGVGIRTISFPSLSGYGYQQSATMVCRLPPRQGTYGYSQLINYSFDTY